jgi:predicted glycosyltransferase
MGNEMMFIIQQRIKKRQNDIMTNENMIRNLKRELEHTTAEIRKRSLPMRIKMLEQENDSLRRKNKNHQW